MYLGDFEIANLGRAGLVDPFDIKKVQPASYDVSLRATFLYPDPKQTVILGETELKYLGHIGKVLLRPGDFILGTTEERFNLPAKLAAHLDGKSTVGRVGLSVHVTAGWIDPGFRGRITLEIKNEGPCNIILKPGVRIGQMVFAYVQGCRNPYSGKYQNQNTVKGAENSRSMW